MDPLELLLECHGRIRRFTDGLEAIAEHLPVCDERVAQTARLCARYFGEALPLHAADEDETLRPRLPASAPLAAMSGEHVWIEEQIPLIVADLGAIVRGEVPGDFAARTRAFSAALRAHIAAEEADIFPLIASLEPGVQEQMVAEMRQRRRS
jgi:hemerythrin-like domain-containing protein